MASAVCRASASGAVSQDKDFWMPPTPMHPRETIDRARQMYREGARVADICAATGIGVGTLYYHLDGFMLLTTDASE